MQSSAPAIEFPSPGAELTYQTSAPAALVVRSPDEYIQVAEHKKTIALFKRTVKEWFAPLKRQADLLHADLCAKEREALQPALDDEARINRALVAYDTEQSRIRRDEQIRLQREQRERDEQQRLEQAAALEREAKATGEASLQEAAQALIDAPIVLARVEPQTPAAPKVEGLSYRDTYGSEVLDLMTLVKAVAAGHVPLGYVMACQSALDGSARALKTSFAVPGVRLVHTRTPVTRTR